MLHLFLDESGECSFSQNSKYKHFLITIISIDDSELTKLKNKLKRQFAYFIRSGWDKTKEIKASELYKDRRFGASAVFRVLNALMQLKSIKISDLPPEKESSYNVRLEAKKRGKSWSGKPIYQSKSSTSCAKLKST